VKLSFKFENLEQLRQVYDPAVVEKAAHATVKQLQSKAATEISKTVRQRYNVSAAAIKSVMTPRVKVSGGVPTGFLIYLSKRISLRHYATGSRPKIKTRRGIRYGARVKEYRSKRAEIVPGAFFGTAKTSGSGQIFQRLGPSRLKIKKLTGPAIAQMVGGEAPIKALNDLVQREGDEKFAHNLDHFLKKQTGIR
jgi:hypothetical protein